MKWYPQLLNWRCLLSTSTSTILHSALFNIFSLTLANFTKTSLVKNVSQFCMTSLLTFNTTEKQNSVFTAAGSRGAVKTNSMCRCLVVYCSISYLICMFFFSFRKSTRSRKSRCLRRRQHNPDGFLSPAQPLLTKSADLHPSREHSLRWWSANLRQPLVDTQIH